MSIEDRDFLGIMTLDSILAAIAHPQSISPAFDAFLLMTSKRNHISDVKVS